MYLCRRLLPQAHITRFHLHPDFARRTLSSVLHRKPVVYSVRFNNDEAPNRPSIPIPSSTHTLNRPQLARPSSPQVPSPDHNTDAARAELKIYLDRRKQDRNSVATLPSSTYCHILELAQQRINPRLINQVIKDVVEFCPRQAATAVLCFALAKCQLNTLPKPLIHAIITHLGTTPGVEEYLSEEAIKQLVELVSNCDFASEDAPPLKLICSAILSHLSQYRVPYGAFALTYRPPSLVHSAFSFVHRLLKAAYPQQALDTFQVLVDLGQVPPEAMQETDSTSDNFTVIIYSALVRASIHWNWRSLAVDFLDELMKPKLVSEYVANLAVDTMYTLLDSPSSADITACSQLLRRVHSISPAPSGLVRQFYNAAARHSLPLPAEELYAFTCIPSPRIVQYPPPQGVALPWLMHHLATQSRRTFLARMLATDVVENHLPIPVQFRARFIADAAGNGYGQLARALWERYSVGKDREVVVGNSALLIRMVSLFSHLRDRMQNAIATRKSESDQESSVDDKKLEERSDDLHRFLGKVVSEYRQHHEPLDNAAHQVLTSFARAHFILGNFTEGFEAFKIMLARMEVPDLYDVNVALTALAEQQPRAAARMIDRMIDKGLEPDVVTYGTVMQHALLQKDTELVEDMVRRARRLKDGRLSLKSVASMVRANVAIGDDASQATLQARLRQALEMIKSLTKVMVISSPQTGKYLVAESLRADDPSLAFRFWMLLLKDSAEWTDPEHHSQRRWMARMIRRDWDAGKLGESQAKGMLSRLGYGRKRDRHVLDIMR